MATRSVEAGKLNIFEYLGAKDSFGKRHPFIFYLVFFSEMNGFCLKVFLESADSTLNSETVLWAYSCLNVLLTEQPIFMWR